MSARGQTVIDVADPAVWDELASVSPLDAHVGPLLTPTRRLASPSFDREVVPKLRASGISVLIRYASRPRTDAAPDTALVGPIAALSTRARGILHTAQRHAIGGMVVAPLTWDPETDAPQVRELLGAGLIDRLPDGDDARYVVHPDLPPPPAVPYAFADAVMDSPDDLAPPKPGPVALLHDLASLAAAIDAIHPKRTVAGPIAAADARRLGERLCTADIGRVEEHPRWGRALRALEALAAVTLDPQARELGLDLGLEATLAGTTEDAVDRLIHRLVDADQHAAVPAVRAALREAGDGAVDEVVFLDLVFEQHRDVLFAPWRRGRVPTYPGQDGDDGRAFDRDGFDAIEARLIDRLLGRLERLGVVRRAPGVFAATADGRRWARAEGQALPPVWVSSDLEVVVPPDGLTPWERFQLERLSRCVARDVVDRYRLVREGLESWLRFHGVDEAVALLGRRCPAVPRTAVDTLEAWARSASRVVVTRGWQLPTG